MLKKHRIIFFIIQAVIFSATLVCYFCITDKESFTRKIHQRIEKDFHISYHPSLSNRYNYDSYVVTINDKGQSLEQRRETRAAVVDALKFLLPFKPSTIAVDVLFEESDNFFNLDSLVSMADKFGVSLVFAEGLDSIKGKNPVIFGFVDFPDSNDDRDIRFIQQPIDSYKSFAHLSAEKYLKKDLFFNSPLRIDPSFFQTYSPFDIKHIHSGDLFFVNKLIFLGVDSQTDRWLINHGIEMLGVELQQCAANSLLYSIYSKPSVFAVILLILPIVVLFLLFLGRTSRKQTVFSFICTNFYGWIICVLQLFPPISLLLYHNYYNSPFFLFSSAYLYIAILFASLLLPFLSLCKKP